MRMRPAMWIEYCGNQSEDALAISGGRISILLHTLATTSMRFRDMAGWSRTDPGFKQRAYVLRPVEDDVGGAEKSVANRFAGKVAAGDFSDVPPYFPGDRTALSFRTRSDR